MARPTKCTPAVIKKFCDARGIGSPLKLCAKYAGITYETFDDWRTIAKEEEKRIAEGGEPDESKRGFLHFLHALSDIEAQTAITWQQVVFSASEIQPDWAYKMLQHWYQDDYKPPAQRNELTGKDGADLPAANPVVIYIPDNNRDKKEGE